MESFNEYDEVPPMLNSPCESTRVDFTINDGIDKATSSISDIFPDSISVDESFISCILEEDTIKKCLDEMVEAIANTVPLVPLKVKLTRKRKRNSSDWLVTKRKIAYERGKSYVNNRNKLIHQKEIKTPCKKGCKFACTENINEDLRNDIFNGFYSLDREGKRVFISQTVECTNVARRTKKDEEGDPKLTRKQTSYSYYLLINETKIKVCKVFYLGTLGISQKKVYNVFEERNPKTGIPKTNIKTTSNAEKIITEEKKEKVRQHINSFPLIDSHYCRAKTSKKYLEPSLNISKMYDLYKKKCLRNGDEPVKESFYRYTFNNEYNIDFHKPKTDRCDFCELFKVKADNNIEHSQDDISANEEHLKEKKAMREEKKKDKEDGSILLVIFDLENVVTLPKADVSSFFYKRKLTVYNLTAVCKGKGYCAIWSEVLAGRAGNDIASGFIALLDKIVENNPGHNNIVVWSDSCVPQNRNSYISHAINDFIFRHKHINSITMKYSIRGHGCVQEVDHMHKKIGDAMKVREFYSPLSFLRVLLNTDRKNPFQVIQMQECHFKDYKNCAKLLKYENVKIFQVRQLRFERRDPYLIKFKFSHADVTFSSTNIGTHTRATKTRSKINQPTIKLLTPRIQNVERHLHQSKIDDLRSMLEYMPLVDRKFYETIL